MSKLDNSILNNIKMLSLDMISESASKKAILSLGSANILYSLFMKYLKFDINNPNWINRDRVIVSNSFLPSFYSTLHMFGYNISIDNLKNYKKLNSNAYGYANINTPGVELSSINRDEIISSSVGIAMGERYLKSLIKIENPKCNLIHFKTYCLCTLEEFMCGTSYEALSLAGKDKLNNLVIIVLKKETELINKNLLDNFENLGFESIEVKGIVSQIDEVLDEIQNNKKPSIILVNITAEKEISCSDEEKISDDDLSSLREKYKLNLPFEINASYYENIKNTINKRLSKTLNKWTELKNQYIEDLKIKEIISFLETKNVNLNFNAENIKLNDNYEEELVIGNSKIFNILAKKSPFILSVSDNFINTQNSIIKSDVMSYLNPLGRNILLKGKTLAMCGIANGIASLGFKVFVSSSLINSNSLRLSIKSSIINNFPVHYIFTQDNFLNTYEDNGFGCVDEINSLRLIPNLINFRPADINEIIGVYSIISNYKKPTAIVIGSEKTKKLTGTNYKYVVAGAYRAKREKGEANGILVATGSEVSLALKISEELIPYGIDLRVVTMPSQELFELQNDRYRNSLLPKELKTFVLEFGTNSLWYKYATDKEYILGINDYTMSGMKKELLKNYKLDIDSLKTIIIELMKK